MLSLLHFFVYKPLPLGQRKPFAWQKFRLLHPHTKRKKKSVQLLTFRMGFSVSKLTCFVLSENTVWKARDCGRSTDSSNWPSSVLSYQGSPPDSLAVEVVGNPSQLPPPGERAPERPVLVSTLPNPGPSSKCKSGPACTYIRAPWWWNSPE